MGQAEQARHEYKIVGGYVPPNGGVEATEAKLNRIAREGWRVVTALVLQTAESGFLLLLERSSHADAQSELLRLQSEAVRLQLEAAREQQEAMAARFGVYSEPHPGEKYQTTKHPVLEMGGMWLAAQEKDATHLSNRPERPAGPTVVAKGARMTDSVPGNRGLALPPADYVERVIAERRHGFWTELFALYHQPGEVMDGNAPEMVRSWNAALERATALLAASTPELPAGPSDVTAASPSSPRSTRG